MKPEGKGHDPRSVCDASLSWNRERGQQLTEASAGHSTDNDAWSRVEQLPLPQLYWVWSAVSSKNVFFSVDKANTTFKAHGKPMWARVRCHFFRVTLLMRREEECSLHGSGGTALKTHYVSSWIQSTAERMHRNNSEYIHFLVNLLAENDLTYFTQPRAQGHPSEFSLVSNRPGLQAVVSGMMHVKHRGNLTESNKTLQNWDEEELCQLWLAKLCLP